MVLCVVGLATLGSIHCTTTGVTKAAVCTILSARWCI